MNIIYPPLVEHSYEFFLKQGEPCTKAEVYKMLLELNLIQENGYPTNQSLAENWIKEYVEDIDLSFEEFLDMYPVFQNYSPNCFYMKNGYWNMNKFLTEQILKDCQMELFTDDELEQIEVYLEFRSDMPA